MTDIDFGIGSDPEFWDQDQEDHVGDAGNDLSGYDLCEDTTGISSNITGNKTDEDILNCLRLQIYAIQSQIDQNAGHMATVPHGPGLVPDCEPLKRDADEICDEAWLHVYLLGYCYPFLLALCILGNALNLVAYTTKCLRKSLTVKLLTAKAIANSIFMIGLSPQVILLLFNNNNHVSVDFLKSLWSVWPYALFASNIAGTCATWLTVLMTLERYLYIAFPMNSRRWCTNANFFRTSLALLLLAVLIHLAIPLNRVAESRPSCELGHNRYVHKLYARAGEEFEIWEPIYYWTNLVLVMAAPSFVLIALTISITRRMLFNNLMPANSSDRKRCVNRITLSTTACHIILATPAVGVYAVAVIYGPTFMNRNWSMCVCHVMMNVANQLNASICFLIYVSCSEKFRYLLLARLTRAPIHPGDLDAGGGASGTDLANVRSADRRPLTHQFNGNAASRPAGTVTGFRTSSTSNESRSTKYCTISTEAV